MFVSYTTQNFISTLISTLFSLKKLDLNQYWKGWYSLVIYLVKEDISFIQTKYSCPWTRIPKENESLQMKNLCLLWQDPLSINSFDDRSQVLVASFGGSIWKWQISKWCLWSSKRLFDQNRSCYTSLERKKIYRGTVKKTLST